MSSENPSPAATTKTPARTTTAIGHRNRTSDKNRGATRCGWGDLGQRKIPDSLFHIWEEGGGNRCVSEHEIYACKLPEPWAGQVKLHSKSPHYSTGDFSIRTTLRSTDRARMTSHQANCVQGNKRGRNKPCSDGKNKGSGGTDERRGGD